MNEKPNRPVTVIPLTLVAVAGLVAQFLAARSAFDLITDNPAHSIAAALLIEAATVVEALVFVRSGNQWAAGGLVLTMFVSCTYNYTQALGADAGLEPVQLIAMSAGPLGALVSVGLALGDELRKYENALVEWRAVQDELAQDAARRVRSEDVRLEREARDQRAWQRQLEQRRLEGELERQRELQAAQLKEKGLALRRAERSERKAAKPASDRTVTGQGATTGQAVRQWADKAAFLADTDRPENLTANQLAEMAGIAPRTARRWNKDSRELIAARSDNGRE